MTNITFAPELHPRDTSGRFEEKTQSRPEVSLHPDATAARATQRRDEHARLMADGALASAYDNVHLMDFEDEHPDASPAEMFEGIIEIGAGWDAEEDYRNEDIAEERRKAVGELSRRIAAGQPGELRELARLRKGDTIDVSRLQEDAYGDGALAALALPNCSEVVNSDVAAGEVYVRLNDGLLVLPEGVLVPVVTNARA